MRSILFFIACFGLLFNNNGVQGWCGDDDSYRYAKDPWKDCEWVASNDKCKMVNKYGEHVGKTYCPESCGYCEPSPTPSPVHYKPTPSPTRPHHEYCYDDYSYRFYGDSEKDCDWVYDNGYCDYEWNHEHVGKKYCPKSCGYCHDGPTPTPEPTHKPVYYPDPTHEPTPLPTYSYCKDDNDFRYWGDDWKDCHWVLEYGKCESSADGKHVGKEYCPKSCGYCDEYHPTPSPVKKPTHAPTPAPVYCQNHVEVEEHCYDDTDGTIIVTFTSCNPVAKDWVGIFHEDAKGLNGDTLLLWQFTCGGQHCSTAYEHGRLFFDDWYLALDEGKYVAYLFKDDSYEVKATSDYFYVKDGYLCSASHRN